MAIQLTKPLVAPEYLNALVKCYIADPITGATTPRPPYTVDLQKALSLLIPGRIARPNAGALSGNDLFLSNSSSNSQCIFKLPGYLSQPEQAAAQTFIFTLDGNDYVGLAFDTIGNLYAAEGNFLDNHIVRYTGTAKPYPGAALAPVDNYVTRLDIGNAGATSYFANLAFDVSGNLWVSDYRNHRLVVFDAGNLGGTNIFHVLNNLDGSIPVANTNAALSGNASHLFAEPEGIDFDAAGNLWVANNNDGSGGVLNPRTSLVKLTPAIQQAVLMTAPGGNLTPTLAQSNSAYFIYQVPNLANDLGARPQFGGLQIDRAAGRIFVNEEVAKKGRGYDIATIAAIGTSTAANDLDIVSTNPGNGGIALVTAKVPVLYIRDNAADAGVQPNTTTNRAWESVDVWVRQLNDGIAVGEDVMGGQPCYVYVRITNKGLSASDGSDIARLYWAKAKTGLSWPAPWDGSVALDGGTVAAPQTTGIVQPGLSKIVVFNWASAPDPANYGNDGHFCLLACIATSGAPEFEGFQGPNLQQNVLDLRKVAWRNIHIVAVAKMKMGDVVMANYTARAMQAQLAFEILDTKARRIDPVGADLLLTPKGAALDKLREVQVERPFLEDLGHGVFRVLDIAAGIPRLTLQPGESIPFGLEYISARETRGHAVRAIQFALEGASRTTIGGQTFVAGAVQGFTERRKQRRRIAFWPWITAAVALALLIKLIERRT
jgi:sugar lactone lactonase YvrE